MSENIKLMIVDDSKVSRLMIANFVKAKKPDWDLAVAEDGSQALAQADSMAIDCFSVDYNMPGIDGLEVIRQLKDRQPEAKIVLMTANIQDGVKNSAEALGVDCVHKPVTVQSIDQMLAYFGE